MLGLQLLLYLPVFSEEQRLTVECGYSVPCPSNDCSFSFSVLITLYSVAIVFMHFNQSYIYIYINLFLNLTTALGCVICPIHFKSSVSSFYLLQSEYFHWSVLMVLPLFSAMNKINTTNNIPLCVIVFLLARVHTVMHKHLFPHNETLGMDIFIHNTIKMSSRPKMAHGATYTGPTKNMISVTYLQYEVGLV